MLLAKSKILRSRIEDWFNLIDILYEAGADLNITENRGKNALMLACGHGNVNFFKWFYDKHVFLYEKKKFNFEHRSVNGRNALSCVDSPDSNPSIRNALRDLVKKGILTEIPYHIETDSKRRNRNSIAAPGTRRWSRLQANGWVSTCLLYTSPSPRDS